MRDSEQSNLKYEILLEKDLSQAHALSVAAGWPHRLEDWAFCLAIGDGIAVRDQGALVGVAMRWCYAHCMTLGLIIVAESHRGRGIASRLVSRLLEDWGDRPAMLHATTAGAGVYARQGFRSDGTVLQFQGQPAEAWTAVSLKRNSNIVEIHDADDLAQVIALDDRVTGMGRSALLRALQVEGRILAWKNNGEVQGYAVERLFGRGRVIGPVIAADTAQALSLIDACLIGLGTTLVRIDIPELSGLQQALIERGLRQVDTVTVMTRGKSTASDTGASGVRFALASQALA